MLRREYHGALGMVGSMFFLEMAGDIYTGHGLEIDGMWATILSVTGASYIIIRFLHKQTTLLRDNGRRPSNHENAAG